MKVIFTIISFLVFIASANSQWTEQSSGITGAFNSVSAVDNQIVWACGDSSKVVKSTNGGVTWLSVPVNGFSPAEKMTTIFALSQSTAFVSSLYFGIYRTTNGGLNWTNVYSSPRFIDGLWFSSPNNGIVVGDPESTFGNFLIKLTSNGGDNWYEGNSLQSPGSGSFINSIFGLSNRTWFGIDGYIYYSNNYGWSWSSQSTPNLQVYSIYFKDTLNGIAGGLSGTTQQLKITSNGGIIWTQIMGPGVGYTIGLAWKENNIWCAKHNYYIYLSTNNGSNWQTDFYNTATTLNHLSKARNGTRMWAVGTNGKIFMSEGLIGIAPISNTIPEYFKLFQNYPNPFNPSTKIKFEIPLSRGVDGEAGRGVSVKIVIYDILGNEITTLVNEQLVPGTYEVEWNAAGNSSGIYYYRLTAGKYSETKKMILLK
jgi:photosystem II stability/assembly factor-like uncharacterized protein